VHPERSDAPVVRLGPGEQWGCEPVDSPSSSASSKRRARAARAVPEAPPVPTQGTLDAENRLLADALRAEGHSDRARAHRLFSELLREHPSSPLAVEARAGLARTRD